MSFSHTIGNTRYTFAHLRELLAKATPLRSGDQLAGVAAESAEERVAAQFALGAVREFKTSWAKYAAGLLFALVVLNAWKMVRERPLVYVEGTTNVNARRPYEVQIPPVLRTLVAERPNSVILMETSVDPEIVALTGIPLRQTINESDLEIYQAALAAPAAHAEIVLAFDGDEVDRAVHAHPANLTALRRFSAPGQASGTLYISDTPSAQ